MEKNNSKENSKENKRRIILMIITLIIIILALLTSCSCTSKFFGKIGSLFVNEGNFLYKEKEGNFCEGGLYCETIINKNLTFDNDSLNILVTDLDSKLTYSFYGIDPKKLTCTTSDASIATCYVNDAGYVVINPKKEGSVIVTLQTEENDKVYQATALVTIGKSNNGIILQQNKGTINLYNTRYKTVVYRFLNINGKVTITSSDTSIATATAENGLLKITAYKTGKVTITLTVEYEGKTYQATYELTVINSATGTKPGTDKDNDSSLSNITTNRGPVSPTFNSSIKDYIINIGENETDLTIIATTSSDKATIIYSYNGISNSTGYFDNLKPGANVINVTITAEDGTINVYTVTVNVPDNSGSGGGTVTPIEKSKLISLTTDHGPVSPTFKPNVYEGYEIEIADRKIKIQAATSGDSEITYTYGSITNKDGKFDNLASGKNIIVVTVKEPGKTTEKYTITVITPSEYDINFISKEYDCDYEDKICKIIYNVKKDGINLSKFDLKDIKLEIIEGTFDGDGPILGTEAKKELGLIFLTPNTSYLQKPIKLKITYTKDGEEHTDITTVTFKTKYYYATPGSDKYDMDIESERPILVNTNLFSNDSDKQKQDILKDMEIINTNKGFKLISKHDSNLWLEIKTDSTIIDYLKLNPKGGLSSLDIRLKANSVGNANIIVTGKAYGKDINETITINAYKAYKVIVSAGEGRFNTASKEYSFTISNKEIEKEINLAGYDKPYLEVPGDKCNTYKFLGFAKADDPNQKLLYSIDGQNGLPNIIKIEDITEDTTFVAIYDKDPNKVEPRPPKTDYIWLVDVPLFYNKEYHDKYNEDKVIYPGAKGSYTMHIGNAASSKITVTGMILEEETICVDINNDGKNDGCLNMGYIIKTGNKIEDEYVGEYLFGNYKTPKYEYQLLHQASQDKKVDSGANKDSQHRYIHRYTKDLSEFASNLSVAPNTLEEKGLAITIHWQWIDYDDYHKGGINDKIDTAIGNYAYEQNKNNTTTINDLYTLKVGLKLEIEGDTPCSQDKN